MMNADPGIRMTLPWRTWRLGCILAHASAIASWCARAADETPFVLILPPDLSAAAAGYRRRASVSTLWAPP
jgi:hypothetical protein